MRAPRLCSLSALGVFPFSGVFCVFPCCALAESGGAPCSLATWGRLSACCAAVRAPGSRTPPPHPRFPSRGGGPPPRPPLPSPSLFPPYNPRAVPFPPTARFPPPLTSPASLPHTPTPLEPRPCVARARRASAGWSPSCSTKRRACPDALRGLAAATASGWQETRRRLAGRLMVAAGVCVLFLPRDVVFFPFSCLPLALFCFQTALDRTARRVSFPSSLVSRRGLAPMGTHWRSQSVLGLEQVAFPHP